MSSLISSFTINWRTITVTFPDEGDTIKYVMVVFWCKSGYWLSVEMRSCE